MVEWKKLALKLDRNKFVAIIKLVGGIYGILSSLIFFLYFYLKINRTASLWFIIPIIIGLWIIFHTRRMILDDTTKELKFSEI